MYFAVPNSAVFIPPQLKYRYFAHVLTRHIFSPAVRDVYSIDFKPGDKSQPELYPPKYKLKRIGLQGTEADLFSTYDRTNVFPRPSNPLYGAYNEKSEFENGYPQTQKEVSTNSRAIKYVGMLNRMANAIFRFNRPTTDYVPAGNRQEGLGKAMPCAFPSGKVIWVGAFEAPAEIAGYPQEAWNSIFPANEAQEAYEKTLPPLPGMN